VNSRGPKVRQAEARGTHAPIAHEPPATSSALAVAAADPASAIAQTGLDPHGGRAQFALLAGIGLSMFLFFGTLALRGASNHPQGNLFLSALSALGLSIAWFYGGSLRSKPRGTTLVSAPHVPAKAVLPARALDVQPTMRRGLWFVLAFFSTATAMFAHLTFWVAARSPNAHTVGAYVGALFIAFFAVLTGAGAIAIGRELRAKPRYGAADRVERWCRVHDVRAVQGSALDPASRVFVIDPPRGGRPIEINVAGYEASPWIVANHALAVFAPSAPDDVELVREDGSPFALTTAEREAINAALEEPRNYRG
jgi:hypothetical protein